MYNSISAAVLSLAMALLLLRLRPCMGVKCCNLCDKHWSAKDCTKLSHGCIHYTVYNRMQRTACLQDFTG